MKLTSYDKLQALKDLLEQGLLCKCDTWVTVVSYDPQDWHEIYQEELVHYENCEGKDKMLKLLNE